MRSYITAALSSFFFGGLVWAQQPTISQKTGGQCSPAVVAHGTVTITCLGLDTRQQDVLRKMPGLLEELLTRNQADRDEIMGKLEEILKFQRDAEAKSAPRHLTESQKRALIEAIKPFSGQHVDVSIPMGASNEVYNFAGEWMAIFRAAGWDPAGINQAVYSDAGPMGVQVTLNEQDVATQKLPAGAVALLKELSQLQLSKVGFKNSQVPTGGIDVRVGPKEP